MTQATSRTRHRWTRAERDALPDDGRRHEIIDGELYVSASPRPRHQLMSAELHALLLRACHEHPELELMAFAAPTDVALADDTVMVPDLIVVPFALIAERDIPGAPLIVVEILSPSTRSVDLVIKKDRLRRAGAAQYWVADPGQVLIGVQYRRTGILSNQNGRPEAAAQDLPAAVSGSPR
ncbi:Uma2 family endonuclease [Piscicoccus intestinalis]|uniref:Uma2 family endonuclease n=1 Tax=Piscicoccus intestinalis TaxID=746033 RepID=UPI00147006CF|nr:Uma2 family endonuclease [Piscicoccus intestinalis]